MCGFHGKIKFWTEGVPVEQEALDQLNAVASLPIIASHLAVMPDVHAGKGATIGSVIPTIDAVIPAAVGVDIGCGMYAVKLNLTKADFENVDLAELRATIEAQIPVGFNGVKEMVANIWKDEDIGGNKMMFSFLFEKDFHELESKYPQIHEKRKDLLGDAINQLGSLGSGNHFLELCYDESDNVWVMVHTGSRAWGNSVGQLFIELAKKECERLGIELPDNDLAYLTAEHSKEMYEDYLHYMGVMQHYATVNRDMIMSRTINILSDHLRGGEDLLSDFKVHCHHNFIEQEGKMNITRKGAVHVAEGDYGIIPGSMGAKSYIVRGLGNAEAYDSCSHGAGRKMSRSKARKTITLEEHVKATEGIECKKDASVLDETPAAYKDIDQVMEAQKDLVEVVHTLRQFISIKG